MFTGMIEEQGTVERVDNGVLRIRDSIAVNDRLCGHLVQGHVDAAPTDDGFTAAIIPHTMEVTSLGHKAEGAPINIAVDVIAKDAERPMEFRS